MRKYLIGISTICLVVAFALCGCSKKADKKVEDKAEETVKFEAPENYASVVQVVINPTVNLYLDADEIILAVEYVNDDAKECYSKIEDKLVGTNLDKGVNVVIETAEADGYLEKNKTVTIDVVETKKKEEKLEILSVATESAKAYMTEKKIDAEVVMTKTTQKEVDDKVAADKAAEEKAAAEKAAAEKAAAEKAAAEKAAAEKAAAEKAAAEKAAAEKAAAEKAAAEKEKKNPKKNLKKGVEYCIHKPQEEGLMLTGLFITFKTDGRYSYAQVPYTQDDYGEGESVVYNGKTYYEAGGGGGAGAYALTDERITLTEGLEMVLTMTTDGKLVVEKIISAPDFLKVGDIIKLK